jgi:hypothetical protein
VSTSWGARLEGMCADVSTAVARLRDVFARYPRLEVLAGCPCCRGPVRVADADLYSLTISLGNTVGGRDDVKALLPLLLERLVTSDELDASIVLGKLPQEHWRGWPGPEQDAVEGYLDAVWRELLAVYPSPFEGFPDAGAFLAAAGATVASLAPFFDTWLDDDGSAAGRHLASLVDGTNFAARRVGPVQLWLRGAPPRERLERAFEADHERPWADDLARAYDVLRP